MNVDKFTDIITKNPLKRVSTTRFRQSAGTLWVKTDIHRGEVLYMPCVSHCGDFIVDWGEIGHSLVSERSHNQLRTMKRSVRSAWLNELAGPVEMGHPFPAVSLSMRYPVAQLGVKKPNAAAIRMLLRGKHPENGTTRYDWHRCNAWDFPNVSRDSLDTKERLLSETGGLKDYREWREGPVERAYKNSFVKPFEKAVQALAYGAIKRENTLKNMTQPLGNIVQNLLTSVNAMSDQLEENAKRYFAPESAEVAGKATPHLGSLADKMQDFTSLASVCNSASKIFYKLCIAPDSVPPLVTMSETEPWEMEFEDKMGAYETRICRNEYWLEESGPRPEPSKRSVYSEEGWWQLLSVESDSRSFLEDTSFKSTSTYEDETTDKVEKASHACSVALLTDHNIKAFSYYWAQRNMHKYASILSRLGYNIPELFGSHPDEWNYTEIAAPLFLDKQS